MCKTGKLLMCYNNTIVCVLYSNMYVCIWKADRDAVCECFLNDYLCVCVC